MSSVKFTSALQGVEKFVRQAQLADAGTRTRTVAAIRRGTDTVRDQAIEQAPERSGQLRYSIRSEFAKDGLTGFVKAGYGKLLRRSQANTERGKARFEKRRAQDKKNAARLAKAATSRQALSAATIGQYAPVVEHGDPRRNKPKRPFLKPALRQNADGIKADLAKAPMDAARASGMAS